PAIRLWSFQTSDTPPFTLSWQSLVSSGVVDTVKAAAEPRQNLAPGHAACSGKFIKAAAVADQRHQRAKPRRAAVRQIGNIDRQQFHHRRRYDWARMETDHDMQLFCGSRRKPRVTVGIAERNEGDSHPPLRHSGTLAGMRLCRKRLPGRELAD